MPPFEPFTFKECLPKESIKVLPTELTVKSTAFDEVILLRLLTGTLNLKNTVSGMEIEQRTNYTTYDFKKNSRISSKTILSVFHPEELVEKKIAEYYRECFKYGNRGLFKNLLLELSNFFYQKEKESHATAFLHLYRSFELISYCFPLFYASKSTSYEKTFVSLKDFFTKTDGERPFFKKFVNEHLFKGDLRLDQTLPIKINAPNIELQKQYYDALKKLCDSNTSIDVKLASPNNEITISRRGLTSLIIDLRNRYFHLLTGDFNDNFNSGELAEIDYFYKIVNDIILNWLAVIYIEILKKTVYK
jgi:hypothetical protein